MAKSDLIVIDFETRSRVDLRKAGPFRYAEDPSTEILCLAYKLPGQKIKVARVIDGEDPHDLFDAIKGGALIEAHNAQFEWAVWNLNGVAFLDWPKLPLAQLFCSAAKAAYHGLPRKLELLAPALGLKESKDIEGHRLMLRMSKPRKPTKKNPAEWVEDEASFQRLYEYCRQDVVVEELCSKKLGELPAFERQVYLLDQLVNARGIFCDLPLVERALKWVDLYSQELTEELRKITYGQVTSAQQVAEILKFLKTQYKGEAGLLKLTKKDVENLISTPDCFTEAGTRVLEIRQLLGLSSIKKLKAMSASAGSDGRIRGALIYYGARTGRAAGRLIQPQNMTKEFYPRDEVLGVLESDDYELFKMLFDHPLKAISSILRPMLRAAPGKVLLAADYAAIEARVLSWLAGDEEALKIFRSGKDIYAIEAAKIYGVELSAVTKAQRQLGKVAILGLGYGMGANKFIETCKSWGIEISSDMAEQVVNTYRKGHPKVVDLWRGLESAAKEAIKKQALKSKVCEFGKVKFRVKDGALQMLLPSKHILFYRDPCFKIVEKQWGHQEEIRFMEFAKGKWVRGSTYGGKLVENAVQALARDIMVGAMLELEMAGFPIIFSVHDEIISEVPKDKADLKRFETIMAQVPPWAQGLPLEVEGFIDERYHK